MLVSGADLGIETRGQNITSGQATNLLKRDDANPNVPLKKPTENRYNTVRGLLCEKDNVANPLIFQFNPSEINDTKGNNWINEENMGFSATRPIWINGLDRIISFKLFFDATAGSNTKFFRRPYEGDAAHNFLEVVKPKGTLHDVEKLMSYQYPISPDVNQARFISGGVIPNIRFMPPPIVIFVFGDIYLECIVNDVGVNHILFNANLTPIRSEASVSLKVLETSVVSVDSRLTNKIQPRTNNDQTIFNQTNNIA